MFEESLNYLRSIKPGPHPDGLAVLAEGIELGKSLKVHKSRFLRESGCKSYLEYRKQKMKEGKTCWTILMGLSSVEEQIKATKEIYEFTKRTGLTVDAVQMIPSGKVALPAEYRDKAPSTTSFVMERYEDYLNLVEAAPLEVVFVDYVLATPNALETTTWALQAGTSLTGAFCQIIWGFPPFDDDARQCLDMVKSIGMVAAGYDEDKMVNTYLDDGLSAYCRDCVSYIGHALLEHYICTTLCGARFLISFGGLLSDIDIRGAVSLALHKALSTEDQPALYYINSSTNQQWDHDIHGNYGFTTQEMLFDILLERKYKMGLGINPVSITEKIAVPTLEELLNIFTAGKRVEEKAADWAELVDFTKTEKMSDTLVEQGRQFFNNIIEGFTLAGIDVHDPLEMILAIKNLNPLKFEQLFHPSTYHNGDAEIAVLYPTILEKQTARMRDEIIGQIAKAGLKDALKDKKIVLASGDAHTYGLLLVEGVLCACGAKVVNGGVDMHAADLLDLADEANTRLVGISCHNGQALDYGKMLVRLAADRGRNYEIIMGGVLNSILPGHTEPSDVADLLSRIGIFAQNDLVKTVEKIKNT